MLLGSRGSRVRCLLVWLAATLAAAVVLSMTSVPLRSAPLDVARLDHTPVDVALVDAAAVALLGCVVWLWVVTTIVVVTVARGVRPEARPPRGVPAGVRRVVLAACGVALAGGLATQPSYADGPGPHHSPAHAASPWAGLPLPDRALSVGEHDGPTPVLEGGPGRARAVPVERPTRTVRVRPGDSLWSIAADDLPRDSTNAAIAAHWQAIYRANRARIGPDPDLIVPGQQLRLPSALPREDPS